MSSCGCRTHFPNAETDPIDHSRGYSVVVSLDSHRGACVVVEGPTDTYERPPGPRAPYSDPTVNPL